jgi:two-component system sensor kinase FixL
MKLEDREKENVNLSSVVQETISIFHSEAIKNNVRIETSCYSDPVWVYGDRIQLQQVLLNFMRNAINAMDSIRPESRLMVIMLSVSRGSATISVHDSGPGIAPEIKDRLFKPFVTNNKKGFGIGLALSRSIIEKHNGEIWALNLPDGGAQFSFRLKIAKNA